MDPLHNDLSGEKNNTGTQGNNKLTITTKKDREHKRKPAVSAGKLEMWPKVTIKFTKLTMRLIKRFYLIVKSLLIFCSFFILFSSFLQLVFQLLFALYGKRAAA
jgi:hypothetical protein